MDPVRGTAEPRRRGSIRPHYGGFQARVTAGTDPATGERIILHEMAATRRDAEFPAPGARARGGSPPGGRRYVGPRAVGPP